MELLVVVTIIVILIALLVPSLDKATKMAQKTKCLTNTRTVAQNCLTYAQDNNGTLPAYTIDGNYSSAYDMRGFADLSKPRSTGLLVGKYLPTNNQLGKVVHCPIMDNSADTRGYAGHCMDVSPTGGSYWSAFPTGRIIAGYNYRAASYFNHTRTDKPKGVLKTDNVNSGFLIYIDSTDARFASTLYGHLDGYNRSFGDGSAGWFSDTDGFIRQQVEARAGMVQDGFAANANVEEEMYEYMSTRSEAE